MTASRQMLLIEGECCGLQCTNCPYLPKHEEGSSIVAKRLIIAGGRDFDDYQFLHKSMQDWVKWFGPPDVILCGMARGADTLGYRYAQDTKCPVEEFPADWEAHGKAAGPMRNWKMAASASHLLAFWDGQSRGTRHMIKEAQRRGLEVIVRRY